MNSLTLETSKKNQIGCGLGTKFGPDIMFKCCEKSIYIKKHIFIFYLGIPFKAKSSGWKITWVEIYGNYS